MIGLLVAALMVAAPVANAAPQPVMSNGLALHISGSGPSIILEAGAASDHRSWADVQPLLSSLGKVVSYDRAGYGDSPAAKELPTALNSAKQLRKALSEAGIAPPYILVGHSYGCAIARVFASEYADDVSALVLLDPAMKDFFARAAAESPKNWLIGLEGQLQWIDNADVVIKREWLVQDASMIQAHLARHDPRDRIFLVSANRTDAPPELVTIWLSEHEKLAKRLGARLIRVEGGHYFFKKDPKVVVSAVQSVLGAGQARQQP